MVKIPQVKELQANRLQLQQESRAIAKDLWSGKLTANEQRALNQICIIYGLDPILKQVVMLGGNVYITGGGLKVIANKEKETALNGIELAPATEEERALARVPAESHYWKATVWKKGCEKPFIEFGEASAGNVRLHQADWKSYQDMAKTRAVNRALRNAYDVAFTSLEEMGYTADVVDTSKIVDVKAESTDGNGNGNKKETEQPEQKAPKTTTTDEPGITEKQQKCVYAITKKKNIDDDSLHNTIAVLFSKEHLSDLTMKEASQLIEEIQK